ncbi:hypothetical protein HDU76_001909 [Blyttiomyces sp. JEL0837]|nr:hypothetical protein HDU76_001909 [Blyttiomyces sp. JEL0837]
MTTTSTILTAYPTIAIILSSIGLLFLARHILGFLSVLASSYLSPGKSPKAYKNKDKSIESWALITGASDGIGKEFALQLAKSGFNVILMARTQSKLDQVSSEAQQKYGVKSIVIPFDFSTASDPEYAKVKSIIEPLDIGVLINNVGVNHEFPTPFLEESHEIIDAIIQVNIISQLKITRLVAPKMVSNRRGLILNIGSVAGTVPSGLLAVYSASKAFLRYWSQAIAMELKPFNVHVEHATTYFVTTSMSKIRKSSWTTPTAKNYVASVLGNLGKGIDGAPYPSHAILMWILDTFTTEGLRIKYSNDMHIDIRKRALRKKEREAKKQ